LPAASDLGIGVICWSPLGGGLLSGHILDPEPGSRSAEAARHLTEAQRDQARQYAALCHEIGAEESAVALSWLLTHPAVTAPIIGPRTTAQVTSAIKALDVTLTPEVLERLDAIFPGPGGEAPEAYAW